MIVNDGAYVMLLVESYFKTFTSKSVATTAGTAEVIMSFSLESREAVDEVVEYRPDLRGHGIGGGPGVRLHVHAQLPGPGRAPLGSLLDGSGRTAQGRCAVAPFLEAAGAAGAGTLSTCLDMYGCCL